MPIRKVKPDEIHKVSVKGQTVEAPADVVTDDSKRLFDKVVEEVLHSDRALFDSLSPFEKNLVLQWLAEAVLTGEADNTVHEVLWELDFERRPVSVDQFIHDEYYLGRIAKDLHPLWKRDLNTVFAPGSKIFEWVMTGSIGSGKTTVAMVAKAYALYRLTCLRSPAAYYGLLRDSLITFGIFSLTKRQVADTGYSTIKGYIDMSPYFTQEFPRNRKIDSVIDFEPTTGKKIKVLAGSTELHAIGLNMFAYAMDEVNFMRAKTDKETGAATGQAYDLYNTVYARLLSRFMRPGGVVPGIMLLMSSRKAQTSFLEEHLKKVKDSGYTYVSDYKLWEVKDKYKFGTKTFKVEVGDRMTQSRVLGPDDKPRPGAQIIEVPEGLRKPFGEDVDQALRDVAGVATFNVSPLIRDRQSVFDAKTKGLPNPFTTDIISVSTDREDYIEDYMEIDRICDVVNGKWRPRLNPSAPRAIHLDLSLRGDCAGFAMGHVSGLVKTEKPRLDGTMSESIMPVVLIDMMFRLVPPLSGEIDLSKIRSFIFYLQKFFTIIRVTADGFQSADMIQILNKVQMQKLKGNPQNRPANVGKFAGLLSVDRSAEPYLSLRSGLFDRRVYYYPYTVLETELLDLQYDIKTGKVDHPERASDGGKGSKDVADAVCGVNWHAIGDTRMSVQAQLLLPGSDSVSTRVVEPKPGSLEPKDDRVIAGHKVSWDELHNNV